MCNHNDGMSMRAVLAPLLARSNRIDAKIESLQQDAEDLIWAIEGMINPSRPPSARGGKKGVTDSSGDERRLAKFGLARVDGKYLVSVEGRAPFEVTAKRYALLEVLSEDDACADDGLVTWKTREVCRAYVSKKTGDELSLAAFNELVKNLRDQLVRDARLPRRIIQTDWVAHTTRLALWSRHAIRRDGTA